MASHWYSGFRKTFLRSWGPKSQTKERNPVLSGFFTDLLSFHKPLDPMSLCPIHTAPKTHTASVWQHRYDVWWILTHPLVMVFLFKVVKTRSLEHVITIHSERVLSKVSIKTYTTQRQPSIRWYHITGSSSWLKQEVIADPLRRVNF